MSNYSFGDIDNPVERLHAIKHLRGVARAMFEDVELGGLALDIRENEWVDQDSFDAGLVAAAKYILLRADRLEEGE